MSFQKKKNLHLIVEIDISFVQQFKHLEIRVFIEKPEENLIINKNGKFPIHIHHCALLLLLLWCPVVV